MKWEEKENKLFIKWCDRKTTDKQRNKIYLNLYPKLYDLTELIIIHKFVGKYNRSRRKELIDDVIGGLLVKSIGIFDSTKKSYSFIYRSILNQLITELIEKPEWKKIVMNFDKNKLFIDDDNFNLKEYEEMLSNKLPAEDNYKTKINNVLKKVNDKINKTNEDICKNMCAREYLNLSEIYINKFEDINIFAINEYVINNSNLPKSIIYRESKKMFGTNGQSKHV